MNRTKKILGAVALLAVGVLNTRADDPAAAIVTSVNGVTTSATTSYVTAAGLGVAVLTVGVIVMMSRRGWRLK